MCFGFPNGSRTTRLPAGFAAAAFFAVKTLPDAALLAAVEGFLKEADAVGFLTFIV
jgi:hypothetical protein